MVDYLLCNCGEIQSITHIVELYPITRHEEGLAKLHEDGPATMKWLEEFIIH